MTISRRNVRVVLAAAAIGLLPICRSLVAAAERDDAVRRPATSPAPVGGVPSARGNRRPQNPMINAAPPQFGVVKAFEPGRSLTLEVRRRGAASETHSFAIVSDRTQIELPDDVRSIAVGMNVTVWTHQDDAKSAMRIVAAAANAGRQPAARGQKNRRPDAPAAGMMNAPTTQLARIDPVTPMIAVFPKREPIAGLAPLDAARQIDVNVDARLKASGVKAVAPSDDAEFVRRVYLDVAGVIPPADKVAAFLDDRDAEKRAKLVDELLASPAYGDHFADLWCDRIAVKDMPIFREPFIAWMSAGLNQGRGWDEIVFDLLTADGQFNFIARGKRLACTEPQALFVLLNTEEGIGKGPNPAWLTAESGRLFLGVQLQCAECHDHPFTKSWKQSDFWGLAAFYGGLKHEGAPGGARWTESAAAAGAPVSIVIPPTALKGVGTVVPARLLNAEADYLPADAAPLRRTLARWMTSSDNPYFAQAAVNRLWADFFGRGLVNPLDDLRPDSPPTHPEVLAVLTAEFKKSQFDLKHLIRCICLSQAYQRGAAPSSDAEDDPTTYGRMTVKVLGPGVLYDSLKQATGWPEMKIGLPERKTKLTVLTQFTPREVFVDFFRSNQGQEADPQEYVHGIPQALKLMNAAQLNQVPPIVDQLTAARLSREQVVEQLFLSALARRPTVDERQATIEFLARRADGDPAEGYAAVMWALVNSAEFVSNH